MIFKHYWRRTDN